MKLRQPSIPCPTGPAFETGPGPSVWTETFEVTTLTPIYGGGVKPGEPDLDMPVRTAAIRGQLRFWWRLLKRNHPENPETDVRRLFEQERELWGGMAESNQGHASQVRLRVHGINSAQVHQCEKSCAEYEPDLRNPQKYRSVPKFAPEVHGYALFPGQGKLDKQRTKIETPPAQLLFPRITFKLDIECRDGQRQAEIIEVLRWWASFGGLGARTRRGLGSVQIAALAPVSKKEAARYGCRLAEKTAIADATQAWKSAVDALRHFRQGVDFARKRGQPPNANRPGRSHWPEPESIRAITGVHRVKADGTPFAPTNPARRDFPRAAFGLPIIFHFQNITGGADRDQQFDPDDCELKPCNHDRMASPLILKAMLTENGDYAPVALLLPNDALAVDLELCNSGAGAANPNLTTRLSAGVWWPAASASQQALANTIRPMQGHGNDVLTAFLDYFSPQDNPHA